MKMIIPVMTDADREKCFAIRKQCFVIEENVPESLEIDEYDRPGSGYEHFLVFEDNVAVGTFRLHFNNNVVAILQRFCMLSEYRRQGYGRYAMDFLEGYCMGKGIKKIRFDAQCTAVEFYLKCGYEVVSDEFVEAGMKHVKMQKKINIPEEVLTPENIKNVADSLSDTNDEIGREKKSGYEIVRVTDRPELKGKMAEWFHEKWGIPLEAYVESMDDAIRSKMIYPQWYAMLDGDKFIAGAGVIENDFHDRPDLTPNVCAVYTEPEYRNKGLAGEVLDYICKDMAAARINTLYLVTNHTSFYERYGWEYMCPVHDDDGTESRMYIHKMEEE